MTVIKTAIWLIVIGCAAFVAFIYSGMYNVAATVPHSAFGRWVFSTTMERSVESHAAGIVAPDNLKDPDMVKAGFKHYRENCLGCHGAPGMERHEGPRNMTPEPPDLSKAAPEWSAAQLYWIVKNGVKMTAMPAWGPTHTDHQLWAIVAFLQKLPGMTPAQFQQLNKEVPREDQHRHD
ncbi:MAG TPA: cytochrome c [Gammaproteobacteria bacterium]|nr:cytochrome c [Gammaproteobacteria bacterium]